MISFLLLILFFVVVVVVVIVLLLLLFPVILGVKFGCLFDVFLVSWVGLYCYKLPS